ncbi:MAG TPA: ABC transporter permease, partial [Polyangia bacterium]
TFELPLGYVDKVRNIVGDRGYVSYENWFGATYPKDEHGFFANLAADDEAFKMYPEIVIPPDQWTDYVQDRQGAIVGRRLAAKYGWKLGDRITLRGTIYPGDWTFNVRAIYTSTSRAVDESSLWFHWKYFNESLEERRKDHVGLIMVKVNDGSQSAAVGQMIDKAFASSPAETRTESEKQFQLEFLSMAGMLLKAIEAISYIVLVILMLVLANTMAMATRERTTEYAVMRAIGFQSQHIVRMVLGEGLIIALLGTALGLALTPPLVQSLGRVLESSGMGGFADNMALNWNDAAYAIVAALSLGMTAASLPAYRAGKLKIVDALRRVE